MPIRYNVDLVLEDSRPVISFRGVDYPVRDVSVKETLQTIRNAEKQESLIEVSRRTRIEEELRAAGASEEKLSELVDKRIAELSPEEAFTDYIPVAVEAIVQSLEGMTKEVAETITLREFKVLQHALREANSQMYVVRGEKDDGTAKKK